MSTLEISIAASFIAVAFAVVIAGENIPGLRYGYSWLERWRIHKHHAGQRRSRR